MPKHHCQSHLIPGDESEGSINIDQPRMFTVMIGPCKPKSESRIPPIWNLYTLIIQAFLKPSFWTDSNFIFKIDEIQIWAYRAVQGGDFKRKPTGEPVAVAEKNNNP